MEGDWTRSFYEISPEDCTRLPQADARPHAKEQAGERIFVLKRRQLLNEPCEKIYSEAESAISQKLSIRILLAITVRVANEYFFPRCLALFSRTRTHTHTSHCVLGGSFKMWVTASTSGIGLKGRGGGGYDAIKQTHLGVRAEEGAQSLERPVRRGSSRSSSKVT